MKVTSVYRILYLLCASVLVFKTCDAVKKKCTQLVSKVPMQRKFDMTRFAGTWYTVTRTTRAFKENTYESASIEFSENADGSYTYSLTGQLDNKCIPVETGTLEVGSRNAQFVLRGSDATQEYPTMVVSYTNYDTAIVYFCFRYRPGRKDQCQRGAMHAEIMSRSTKPKKKFIKDYLKRIQKRLCVSPKDMHATKPGVCKIPDILAKAKDREADQDELIDDASKKHCAVNNIPVQKKFQLEEMEGLWYEIARTRFTFNKMESVISYHRYDPVDNAIKSFYTGTTNGNCSTPIQGTSRTKEGAKYLGDMEGKIDGDFFVWSPLKILYVDTNYLMFYACYSGESELPCVKDLMEVTLVGRTRQISEDEKSSIYERLSKICVNPADMTDTKFVENCTEWVENVINEKETDPSSCALDGIPAYSDFDDISMLGDWYLYAQVNYTDSSPVVGNTVNISRGPVGSMVLKHAEKSCRRINNVYTRQRCLDTGDYVTTLPEKNKHGWVLGKILFQDDNTFVYYVCTERNLDGRCNIEGVHAFIYTRNQTLTEHSEAEVNKVLKSACINPTDLVKTEDWCDDVFVDENEAKPENDVCDIDNIAIFNDIDDFNQAEIYGYWYEIAHSSGIHNGNMNSLVAYFTSYNNVTLQIYYSGIIDVGKGVVPVQRVTAIPRCYADINGDYLTEVPQNAHDSNITEFTPMKVLFTDYNVLLTFICQEMLPTGRCSDAGEHIRLWSRNASMDENTREYVMDFAYWACVDPTKKAYMVDTSHNASVMSKLEEYVVENDIEFPVDEEEYEREEQTEPQADDTELDFDDLQRYFDMDDDFFYNLEQ